MTEQELAEIQERCAEASPGPWKPDAYDMGPDNYSLSVLDSKGLVILEVPSTSSLDESNLLFVAHARTDVPALLAEIARLKAENARLREALALRHELVNESVKYGPWGEKVYGDRIDAILAKMDAALSPVTDKEE